MFSGSQHLCPLRSRFESTLVVLLSICPPPIGLTTVASGQPSPSAKNPLIFLRRYRSHPLWLLRPSILFFTSGRSNLLAAPKQQVNPIIDDCLPLAMSELLMSNNQVRGNEAVSVLSCLIKHGAGPTPRQVSLVGSKAGFEAARKCFLDAVCSAVNPLLVGMRLSLLLADAAERGNEGQRQVRLLGGVSLLLQLCFFLGH